MHGSVVCQTIEDIHALIEDGKVGLGGRLPPERDIADLLCVSRSTVRAALAQMEEAGEIERHRGRGGGTFVAENGCFWERYGRMNIPSKSNRLIDRLAGAPQGFSNAVAAQGFKCDTHIIYATRAVCSYGICSRFGLKESRELYRIERVRSVEGNPLSFEQTYLDPQRFPQLLSMDLTQSIYDIIRLQFEIKMERVDEQIEVMAAYGKSARFLEVDPGQPLLRVRSRAYVHANHVIVMSDDLYRPDRVRLNVENQIEVNEGESESSGDSI